MRQSIDVAKQSTLEEILEKVKDGAGIWCKPEDITSTDVGKTYSVGELVGGENGSILINFRNELYAIPNNSNILYVQGGTNVWRPASHLPYEVNVHETCVLVFNDEIHVLGGYGFRSRSHIKWDGENWTIASELPYVFCAGKAIVFQDRIHILGGGTNEYSTTYSTGFINKHFSWDGEKWEEASSLPYKAWGALAFVCSGQLHLIGGGTINNDDFSKNHYVWDGISWSKTTDLSFKMFNGSCTAVASNQIYVLGGLAGSNGKKQNIVRLFNGTTWSVVTNLPNSALNDSGQSTITTSDREMVVLGSRGYILKNGVFLGLQEVPVSLNKGDVVNYKNKIHMFYQKKHVMWNMEEKVWETIGTIPYNFFGGSVVVYKDKIHLIGSASSGVEDYHYTWCEEEGYVLRSNLPIKFSNGTAVVFNDELHIIGGTHLKDTTYNHYKFNGGRWIVVGTTDCTVMGPKSSIAYNNAIYALGQKENNLLIRKFNGIGWSTVFTKEVASSADDYKYLSILQNRLHVFCMNSTSMTLTHDVWTGEYLVPYKEIQVSSTPSILSFNNCIYYFMKPSDTMASIMYRQYDLNGVPGLGIYIPKGHQFLCNKKEFLPVIGEVMERESGYEAITSGYYLFVKYGEIYSVS